MQVTVDLPGLTLSNVFSRVVPVLENLSNWHNASETLRDSEQREHGFGLFSDDDPAESGRFPVVYGKLSAHPDGDVWALRDLVMGLKNLGTFEMAVTDPSGLWRSQVSVSGQIQFDVKDDGWCTFEIPLEADDPRKYGQLHVFSTGIPTEGEGVTDPVDDPVSEGAPGNLGRVQLTNHGTAPAEPIVRISGGIADGFELRCLETGHVVRVTRPVLPESVITVDHGAGEVWVDGQSILPASYVPVGEWFQVPPGGTCTIQWAPFGAVTGSPQMVVEFAEASW